MRPLFALSCFAAAGALALAGCAVIVTPNEGDVRFQTAFSKDSVLGDGHLKQERRAVSNLTELDMTGPVHMEVRVGHDPSLQVEADGNLLPLVHTEASGATLRVWVEGSVRTNNAIRVIYTVPQLAQVRSTGSGRLVVRELNGGALTLTKTGSGASELSGKVDQLHMQISCTCS
jgi:hypothetical protein